MENKLELVKSEKFGKVECNFYKNESGDVFVTRNQIGRALEYNDPNTAIRKIHDRHKQRLDKFSVQVKMVGTDNKKYNTFVYNAKGIYEICRYSEQPKADAFYDWVYDILESLMKNGSYSLDTNGLMKQLTQSQITLNNVLAGFKMQIDNDFKVANEKISEHDELLKKRVYLSAKEAKDIQNAIRARAQEISLNNGFRYHKVKGRLFKRLYMKLNDIFEVATYRELPSIYYENILNTIRNLNVGIFDLREEECQLSLNIN